jgi:hypothetical protein
VPGSRDNTRESTIIIRHGSDIDAASLRTAGLISVRGSMSGDVAGAIVLARDGKTVIFTPRQPFIAGEIVNVRISEGMRTATGRPLPAERFSFSISARPLVAQLPAMAPLPREKARAVSERTSLAKKTVMDSLPANFPGITTTVYDETAIGDGYVFLAVAAEVEGIGYYLLILDNDGTPVRYKELPDDYAYDFKVQPNGLITYAQFISHHSYTGGGDVIHMVMDRDLNIIDSVQMGNGYIAEAHDFQMLPNGHYLLFGYYLTPVDMSAYVKDGKPDALVSGGIVQELDADKNVVFQWRSWDHYDFEGYNWGRFATRDIVSEFHLNTINLDVDENIFLGTPQWVKKIDRQTGEILWHLGGDENEFSFIGVDSTEAVAHFGGHNFHRLPDGHVLLYDNGDRQGTRSSQIHEYILDEANRTAEHVWTWTPPELIAGWHRGNAQRLPNGNTMIGWGGGRGDPIPTCTEVAPDGAKVFELYFDDPAIESYRAFRFPLPDGGPCANVTEFEVSPGLEYDFVESPENNTGISVRIDSIGGSGYNEMTVKKYCFAPLYPEFSERAPRVLPLHLLFAEYNISSIVGELHFDVLEWDITDPEHTTVYWRAQYGSGLFTSVTTTYNRVTGKVIADASAFGEYILTQPDVEAAVFVPQPYAPVDAATVNRKLPVTLEWNPVGQVEHFALQVSDDDQFTNLLVDEQNWLPGRYVLPAVMADAVYYWRVKASNAAGESDWCPVQTFSTVAPSVALMTPDGGEQWQLGLDYYVRWDDNIAEDITISLYRDQVFVADLETTPSDGAWLWSIPTDIPTGDDYRIRLTGMDGDAVTDESAEFFSIIDTTATGVAPVTMINGYVLGPIYPNPAGSPSVSLVAHVGFILPTRAEVTLRLFDFSGRVLRTVHLGTRDAGTQAIPFDISGLPSGQYLYTLETPAGTLARPMTVVR